jgi:hypothetical protein
MTTAGAPAGGGRMWEIAISLKMWVADRFGFRPGRVHRRKDSGGTRKMTPSIPIFGLEWHIRESPAQRLLVSDPLAPYARFEQIPWDGERLPALTASQRESKILAFFQLPPPPAVFEDPSARIVWIPMWDEARGYEPAWWGRLPKNLRVVSFSREVSRRSKPVGLETLELKYFPPDGFPEADWAGERVLFHWNRSSLVGRDFLFRFCRALDVDRLVYFRTARDGVPAGLDFSIGDRIGKTRIQALTADGLLSRRDYSNLAGRANIFLAPRTSEGVGLTFLEAMACGCAVFAFDAATMNEYITHGQNGFLLRRYGRSVWNRVRGAIEWRAVSARKRLGLPPGPPTHPVSGWQDWNDMRLLNLKKLGDAARRTHQLGVQEWTNAVPQYARFILDW